MEPRPYQAEAFDAARKANVVMVGATGVGKVGAEWETRIQTSLPASLFRAVPHVVVGGEQQLDSSTRVLAQRRRSHA